jgi:hypothetical protein
MHRSKSVLAVLTGTAVALCAACNPAGPDQRPDRSAIHPRSSDASDVGALSPLIPFHKDAIHAALVWTGERRDTPKICYWMRPAEYVGTHLVDPDGLSPDGGETGGFIVDFEELVRGGSAFSDRLDRSVQSRIKADIPMDNGLCLDLTHPHAFKNKGVFELATYDEASETWTPNLDEDDYDLNRAAFANAGHSAGLNYNIFCSGNVQLPDGRLLFVGGHDIDGNHGLRKTNIFDPVTETWLQRTAPPVKTAYLTHPSGDHSTHDSPHPDANEDENTDPSFDPPGSETPFPGDMTYQRWYPSAATLPDGRVLILSGTDDDTGNPDAQRVSTATPEIYDPETDTTVALENARKLHPNYPPTYVVQTGPGAEDWKVAVLGESVNPPTPISAGQVPAIGDSTGNTYLLDVRAAEAGDTSVGAEDHWELVDTASHSHNRAGLAAMWELDALGMPVAQKVAAFGGTDGEETVATVEMIDYQDEDPAWARQQDLVQPANDNTAVVLPNGEVLVIGGESPRGTQPRYSLVYQRFDPATGEVDSLLDEVIPWKDHTTALLLPDASVIIMGTDRTELIADDLIPGVPGDRDVGVPVARVYKPAYLFQGPRPRILSAPEELSYGERFDLKVAVPGREKEVSSVVLIRPSPVTHKWDWGNRYVKLSFEQSAGGRIRVRAPAVPGLAVPGYYMLFVLSSKGVPSEAALVHFSVP